MPPPASTATCPAGGGAAPRTALAHHHAHSVNGAAVIRELGLERLGAAVAVERANAERERPWIARREPGAPERPEVGRDRVVEDDLRRLPVAGDAQLDARDAAPGGDGQPRDVDLAPGGKLLAVGRDVDAAFDRGHALDDVADCRERAPASPVAREGDAPQPLHREHAVTP